MNAEYISHLNRAFWGCPETLEPDPDIPYLRTGVLTHQLQGQIWGRAQFKDYSTPVPQASKIGASL